jgi:hypothetical protein
MEPPISILVYAARSPGSIQLYMLWGFPRPLPLATGTNCIHHIHDGESCNDDNICSSGNVPPTWLKQGTRQPINTLRIGMYSTVPSATVAACCNAAPSFSGPGG